MFQCVMFPFIFRKDLVLVYCKCGMVLIITKFHKEKSCLVSPLVATNFFQPTPQMKTRNQFGRVVSHGFTY